MVVQPGATTPPPAQVSAPPEPEAPGSGPRTGTRSRPRALIVDDHDDTREMYAWCLRASGWNVAAVTNGIDALAAAPTFRPDVVVMDLSMPVLGGIDAIRFLRANAVTAGIAIVACTGLGRIHEAEARAAGCDVFVEKPCSPDDLCALVETLVAPR